MPQLDMMGILDYWLVPYDHQSIVVRLPVTVIGSAASWTNPVHSTCYQPSPSVHVICINEIKDRYVVDSGYILTIIK